MSKQLLLALASASLLALPVSAVTIDWVAVGNPGNPADAAANCYSADCGSVPYSFRISKYEVTNAQYAEFLNAVAAADPNSLYHSGMGDDPVGGITRSGSAGSYSYAVKAGFADQPVVTVSWYDAARFSNWLHNGQPTGAQGAGTTETGAYTLTGPTSIDGGRQPGALAFLPTENEWYKAAYYDPAWEIFWEYPTGTIIQTACVAPGSDTGNSANCLGAVGGLTDVGAYGLSGSPYGTFDQGGNVWEWNETASGSDRVNRGGAYNFSEIYLPASFKNEWGPTTELAYLGFRVASPIPEPGTALLVMAGLLGLAACGQRTAKSS